MVRVKSCVVVLDNTSPFKQKFVCLHKDTEAYLIYSWEHECTLDSATLDVLCDRQKATLSSIRVGKCSDDHRSTYAMDLCKLKQLSILNLQNGYDAWLFPVVVMNYPTLRRLSLGGDFQVADHYKRDGDLNDFHAAVDTSVRATQLIVEYTRTRILCRDPTFVLTELHLCGLDINHFIAPSFVPRIDFNSLRILRLESCAGLKDALLRIADQDAAGPYGHLFGLTSLETLVFRLENQTCSMLRAVQAFLERLRPLKKLHLLLEGCLHSDIAENVLRKHGPSLQSLIWDERGTPRISGQADDYSKSGEAHMRDLELIINHCPSLRALGIPIFWPYMKEESFHPRKQVGPVKHGTLLIR